MKVQNAVNKLTKLGMTVTENQGHFTATKTDMSDVIEFSRNGGSDNITCIRVRRSNEQDDFQTDYFAGVYADNMAQAIRLAS